MKCVRFHHLAINKKQIFKFLAFSFIFSVLVLSACSENITSQNTAENSVAFDGSSNIKKNALGDNDPSSTIINPPTDITVNQGEKIYFSGSGFDPTGNYPLSYQWNFGGIQPNGLTQNPGFVTMNNLGTFRVELVVTNNLGISNGTREVRTIKVKNPNAPITPNIPGNTNPIAIIGSPVGDINIAVGDTLNFVGSGISPAGNEPLKFLWNFGNVAPNTTTQNPGNITFTQPGTFPVSLSVTDNTGLKSNNAAMVTITVTAEGVTNIAPSGNIISPPGDLTIKAGESLYFAGSAIDADAISPPFFSWDFAGAAPNSVVQAPGIITFPNPGIYPVRLIVIDDQGMIDPNPPVRIVTVSDVAVQNNLPLGNVIISPSNDVTINAGESINFQGEGNNGSLAEPLRYLWHFERLGLEPVIVQNPGDIVFDRPGKFSVELIIADANGNVVSHEVERKITVQDPNALLVHIHEPATNQTINVGQSISFVGMVIFDPLGSNDYLYQWEFDRAAPNSSLQNPEPVVFTTAGTYEIELTLRDPLTGRTAKAERRLITVVDPNALQVRILNPMSNPTINIGDTLNFAAETFDPLGTGALEYMWKFDGAAPDMAVQNAGDITFNTAGKFRIHLHVYDRATARNTASSNITVTVKDPTALMAEITSPTTDKLIFMGESINFMGMGSDPLNDATMLMYNWKFGRGITSTEQNPGAFTYDMPGDYEVEFHVDDPLTNRHSNRVQREIHVMPLPSPASGVATTVKGSITSPASNMTISAGDVINFSASGIDPAGTGLTYFWNFGGAALNTTVQNPGAVMFSMPGIYVITLTVANAVGEIDPNPPFVIITVI